MDDAPEISFGDHVRVRSTEATRELRLADQTGQVYGLTTPSVTGVQVIGALTADRAIAVQFHERKDTLWFSPDLLEFVDHAPGTEISLKGVPKKWIRTEGGTWSVEKTAEQSASHESKQITKPWWRFW